MVGNGEAAGVFKMTMMSLAQSGRNERQKLDSDFTEAPFSAVCLVCQVGEPSAVLLLRCSADTMSSRALCRSRSYSISQPASDAVDVLHRRAESFCSDSEPLAAYYEDKRLLHTVSFSLLSVLFFLFFSGHKMDVCALFHMKL